MAGPDPAGQYGIGGIHVASGEPSAALPMGMDPATPLHQPGWYDPMTNSYWPVAPAPWAPAPTAASYHPTPSPIAFAPASTLPQLPSWPQAGMQSSADATQNPSMVTWAMAPSAAPELAPAGAPGDAPPAPPPAPPQQLASPYGPTPPVPSSQDAVAHAPSMAPLSGAPTATWTTPSATDRLSAHQTLHSVIGTW